MRRFVCVNKKLFFTPTFKSKTKQKHFAICDVFSFKRFAILKLCKKGIFLSREKTSHFTKYYFGTFN